jgi:ABC-type glycerol-3-phosphate transport system substrate-binding protein
MEKRNFLLVLLTALLMLMLVACGGGEQAEEPAAEEPPPAEEPAEEAAEPAEEEAAAEVTEIEFYFPEGFGRPESFAAVIEAFEEKYPDIKVNVRLNTWADFKPSLPIMWASDNVSDVVLTDGPDIQEYAFNGALLPLDDLFPESDWGEYAPGVMQEITYEGSVYGAPFGDSAIAFYCNSAMFDAAGIEKPTTLEDAWTWDEWLTNVTEIAAVAEEEQGRKVWGLVGLNNPPTLDYWTMWIPRSAGEKGSNTFKGISDDGTTLTGYLDTPEAIEALKFYQALFQEHELMPTDDVPDAFGTEQSVCYMAFTSLGNILANDYPDLEWFVMPLPYFVTPITHTGSFAPSVSAKSEHPEEAKKFIEYLTKEEGLLLYNELNPGLPAKLSARDEVDALQGYAKMFVDLNREWGVSRPPSPGHAMYAAIVGDTMMVDIALGADVEEAVQAAIMEAEAQLAQFKK